jgi:uncharacterized membrane protein
MANSNQCNRMLKFNVIALCVTLWYGYVLFHLYSVNCVLETIPLNKVTTDLLTYEMFYICFSLVCNKKRDHRRRMLTESVYCAGEKAEFIVLQNGVILWRYQTWNKTGISLSEI